MKMNEVKMNKTNFLPVAKAYIILMVKICPQTIQNE